MAHERRIQADPFALLGTSDVQALLGVSRITIFRWVRDGAFPPPDMVIGGVRAIKRWRRATVDDWIQRRIAGDAVTIPKRTAKKKR